MRRKILSLALLLAGSLILSGGCSVSPQPSPPGGPVLELGLVSPGLTPESAFEGVVFRGAPGSVSPAEGVVLITNLDRDDAVHTAPVAPDGSFELAVSGSLTEQFRLQTKSGDARGEPVDLRIDGASFALVVPGLDDCLFVDPERWVALGAVGDARSLVLENACEEPVSFAAPRLRRGLAGFGFSPTSAFEIAPGASATITVRASGPGAEREDVLLLEADGTRRPITLSLPD